jgi:thioester reductase-like protein
MSGLTGKQRKRIILQEGDLLQPQLGLSSQDLDRLTADTTRILHGAGSTRFSLPLAEARRANVATTTNLVDFSTRCQRLQRFGFLSTAYVAGTRTGTIFEADLEPTQFVNTYEQSKWEAERVLRTHFGDLPIAVYRLSTIVGSSSTGTVPKMNAIHRSIELAYRGMVPMAPGDPDTIVDLLDLEYTSSAVARLFTTAFEAGATYHIVAGPDKSYTLKQFIDETHRIVLELDPAWAERGIEVPPLVSAEVFAALETMIRGAGDVEGIEIIQALLHFTPQMFHPKRFDTTNRDQAIPSLADPPDIRDYYPKILEFCLHNSWNPSREGSP